MRNIKIGEGEKQTTKTIKKNHIASINHKKSILAGASLNILLNLYSISKAVGHMLKNTKMLLADALVSLVTCIAHLDRDKCDFNYHFETKKMRV